jgi:putative DNA primase/helicase
MQQQPLSIRAQGRWPGILQALGIDRQYLSGKHTGCPICRDGKDRFRFDNKEGKGSFFCSVCGAGDGVKLVMLTKGLDFKTAAKEIEGVLGTAPVETGKPALSDTDKRAAMNRLWASSTPVQADDPVALYLFNRVRLQTFPKCLRTAQRVRYEDEQPSYHPAMIAMVMDPEGRPTILHRTYLTKDGRKASVEAPRRMMPGHVAKGSSVRLVEAGPVLGIAEGIETAFSASALFGVPCWAAVNASMLAEWLPPEGVEEVIVFGDNDAKFAGQAAAFALARKLSAKGLKASVKIPQNVGQDWNDVFQSEAFHTIREAAE